MGLKSFDLQCPMCFYTEVRTMDFRDYNTEEAAWEAADMLCPSCEESDLQRAWITAPFSKVNDYDRDVAAMKQNSKERFVKNEMESVQHRHGKIFGDAVRSAAVDRIKKGEKPI